MTSYVSIVFSLPRPELVIGLVVETQVIVLLLTCNIHNLLRDDVIVVDRDDVISVLLNGLRDDIFCRFICRFLFFFGISRKAEEIPDGKPGCFLAVVLDLRLVLFLSRLDFFLVQVDRPRDLARLELDDDVSVGGVVCR